jgi:hypothetical protein
LGALFGAAALAAAACGEDITLPDPVFENNIDTITLYALRGTEIQLSSAFDIVNDATVRTDLSQPFDFVFDIDPEGTPQLGAATLVGVTNAAGLIVSEEPFDQVLSAPEVEYESSEPFPIVEGMTLIGQSRGEDQACSLGPLPRYGKFLVLSIDATARSVTLQTLVNRNCGYRGLQPGLPEA